VAFLLPIPVSLVLAVAWCSWVSRPRRPKPVAQSVADYHRALAALAPQPRAAERRSSQPPSVGDRREPAGVR
jgi:hypothetical protein